MGPLLQVLVSLLVCACPPSLCPWARFHCEITYHTCVLRLSCVRVQPQASALCLEYGDARLAPFLLYLHFSSCVRIGGLSSEVNNYRQKSVHVRLAMSASRPVSLQRSFSGSSLQAQSCERVANSFRLVVQERSRCGRLPHPTANRNRCSARARRFPSCGCSRQAELSTT